MHFFHLGNDSTLSFKATENVVCRQAPNPSTSTVPPKLSARMVNYHDPATIAQDYGAYVFPSGLRG
jgi:hypothetical protein